MSRGLGRLQRYIKEQIYRAEREWKRENIALRSREKLKPGFDGFNDSVKSFFLTWPRIRFLIEENPDFNPGPYRISPSLEQSVKRALRLLVKRGEIAQHKSDNRLAIYMTKETDQSLRESSKAFMEGFARMKAAAQSPTMQ
jgi:hypothetical protein